MSDVDDDIRAAVETATSVPCDHRGAHSVCSGCAERMARALATLLRRRLGAAGTGMPNAYDMERCAHGIEVACIECAAELTRLRERLEAEVADHAVTRSQLDTYRQQRDEALRAIREANESDVGKLIGEYHSSLAEKVNQLAETRERLAAVEGERDEARRERNTAELRAAEHYAAIEVVSQDLAEARARCVALESERDEARAEVLKLEHDCCDHRSEADAIASAAVELLRDGMINGTDAA